MNNLDRNAIKARTEAATEGPWSTGQEADEEATTWIEHPRGDVLNHDERGWGHMLENFSWMKRADAEFIAHAREDVPALLTALEEAEGERDDARLRDEEVRSLVRLETSKCPCTYGDGPQQDCPQHGDISWFAGGLAIARARAESAERRAARAELLNTITQAELRQTGRVKAERDRALARAERVREAVRGALAGHPECDKHDDADPVSCGWKRAVQDVNAALERIAEGLA